MHYWAYNSEVNGTSRPFLRQLREQAVRSIYGMIGHTKVFICLDEIQSDLNVRLGSLRGHPSSLFHLWNESIQRLRMGKLSFPLNTVYSGTSLNAEEALEDITGQMQEHTKAIDSAAFSNLWADQKPKATTFSDFPAVSSKKYLKHIFDVHLEHWAKNDVLTLYATDILDIMYVEGRVLHGRPRWSVLYTRTVDSKLNAITSLSPAEELRPAIQGAVQEARKLAKEGLVKRLRELSKRSPKVMNELFWVVMNSYLKDRPTAFSTDIVQTMISEAFAVMKPTTDGSDCFFLAERVAVEAGKEFFMETDVSDTDQMLLNYMGLQQSDITAYGKSSEYFLAWRLYRALPRESARLDGSIDGDRAQDVLDLSSKAQRLPNSQNSPVLGFPDYASIIEAREEQIGHLHTSVNDLPAWLRDIRTRNCPAATFFFPEKNAGPDLLFALKWNQTGNDCILLCVVQISAVFDPMWLLLT